MKNPKLAEKLLQKAEQDLHAFAKWRHDTEIAEEILGFHAQQAAEKMLKAVLAYHAIDFPFTHRLSDLIDLGAEHGIVLPVQLEEVRFLTPFAVEFRYDFYEDDEPLDSESVFALLTELQQWATLNLSQT